MKPIIGITMGDPTGIGPEIIMKTLSLKKIYEICKPVVIGSSKMLENTHPILKIQDGLFRYKTIDIIDINSSKIHNKFTGKLSLDYIKKAIDLALNQEIDAIVTGPVSKKAIIESGNFFTGHTEFLAKITKTKEFAMMMVSSYLKIVLVSTHLPLKEVSNFLTKDKIYQTIKLADIGLKKYFGIKNPKIGICALNPHSGEDGKIGNEEKTKIIPAIKKAKKNKMNAFGPLSSDTLFYQAKQKKFDVVIAMYHDQGLIPIKLLSFDNAVNLTLGLPIIRTSVDHGPGFDIVNKNIASPNSMIEAIKLAVNIVKKSK